MGLIIYIITLHAKQKRKAKTVFILIDYVNKYNTVIPSIYNS